MSFYERLIEQGRVRRSPVRDFNPGDGIGTYVEAETERPRGTVVISEPDSREGWHLGWTQPDAPGYLFHWRGDIQARDRRWVMEPGFLIDEMP